MSSETLLDELVSIWQREAENGRFVVPTELCRDCPELAAELERRVDVLRRVGWLGEGSPTVSAPDHGTARSAPDAALLPSVVPILPGYCLEGQLGKGGMGIVYRARQVYAGRVVALKMLRSGREADAADRARFRTEAEAMARLAHPNIVHVYEVGEHEGRPFFSMEFCSGGTLGQRLNGTPLRPREAAQLLETLARAVQAAHDKGVLHRDLKPANILLASRGGEASEGATIAAEDSGNFRPLADLVPKVTDFGLAKKLDDDGQTHSGAVLGTPSYMAPEQASGRTRQAGPETDTYALGAILYECLTGRPPFKGATLTDTLLMVRHDEPVPPSQLQRTTPRDLETICLKCLQKEPGRRYRSAADLADDLARFLRGEPVTARAVGRAERLWRWSRRNPRVAVLLGVLALVVASALVSVTVLWRRADEQRRLALASAETARREQEAAEGQRRRADEERQAAEQQRTLAEASAAEARRRKEEAEQQRGRAAAAAEKAERVATLLGGIFEASDPLGVSGYGSVIPKASGEALTARQLLDRGAARIAADASLAPEIRAHLRNHIGNAYLNLSELDLAEPHLQYAYEQRLKLFGPNHPETAASLHNLARLAHVRGDYVRAEKLYRQALAVRLALVPVPEREVADTEFNLAWLLAEMEDFPEAARLYGDAIRRREAILGPDHREVGVARAGLAGVYVEQGDWLAAAQEAQRAAEILKAQEGGGTLVEAVELFQQAVIGAGLSGNHFQAEKKLCRCEAIMRAHLGEQHVYLTLVLFQLALSQEKLGKLDEAERNYRECLDIVRGQVGLTHPKAAVPIAHLAALLHRRHKDAEAEKLFDEWLAAHRAKPGPFRADALTVYGHYLRGQEERQRAVLEEALALFDRESPPPRRANFSICRLDLSTNYLRAGRLDDAERLAVPNVESMRKRFGERSEDAGVAVYVVAMIRLRRGQFDAETQSLLEEAQSLLTPTLRGAPHPDLPYIHLDLSELHRRRGRPEEACASARQARNLMRDTDGLIEIARVFARCSTDALGGTSAPTPEQQAASRTCADEAITTLRKAAAAGYRDAAALRRDSAFTALKDNKEFAELLRQMERPRP
jgi:hypothetical protein